MTNIVTPSILPGFNEYLPEDQILFNNMMDTIRHNYESFGFLPIDTPVLEKAQVLLAKGGGDTEKQVYRFSKGDTDMAMRFDLTVPLARYVAQHFSELSFPFRRYHIAKVYRGERNQKGRYREFYQCDIDIIGNGSLAIENDGEIPAIICRTFRDLGFDDFTLRINNRKLLTGFYRYLGIEDSLSVLRIVDKLDKIGIEKTIAELEELGLSEDSANRIMQFIAIEGNTQEVLKALKALEINDELFSQGVLELEQVVQVIELFGVTEKDYKIDLSIARGLDYYTGTVYETTLDEYPEIGSVCSGGRYDNLADYYTKQSLPGVGISIGLSRLFFKLKEAGHFKDSPKSLIKALIIPMGDNNNEAISLSTKLQDNGIACQIYLESGKINKKFKYADQLGVEKAIIVGAEEVETGLWTLRDMVTGEQEKLSENDLISLLKNV
ncbi:MAG: histidine--tRNA ligase [Tissierellia bacterium]|nr:histidine--tRNA ligase [Tissierellia bacterium]